MGARLGAAGIVQAESATAAFGLRRGAGWEATMHPLLADTRRLSDCPDPKTTLGGLWRGAQADRFAEAVVIGTAAVALETLGAGRPEEMARHLWGTRNRTRAA